jgi:capsular polysaccharide biosynthesis protein
MFKRFWPCLLIIPVVTLVVGFLTSAVITYIMPKKYESFATIEIHELSDQSQFRTEMEKLTSATVLNRATDQLDLTTRWGTDRQTCIDLLRDLLIIEQIRGTDLVRIRARHTQREDARDTAMAVVNSYQSIRSEQLESEKKSRLQALQAAISEQEQKVAELRARKMGGGASSPHSDGEVSADLDALHDQETDVLMKMKVDAGTLSHSGSGAFLDPWMIIVHDEPLIADRPYSPNVGLNLTLGTLSGLLLGFPLALAIMAMLHRRSAAA